MYFNVEKKIDYDFVRQDLLNEQDHREAQKWLFSVLAELYRETHFIEYGTSTFTSGFYYLIDTLIQTEEIGPEKMATIFAIVFNPPIKTDEHRQFMAKLKELLK